MSCEIHEADLREVQRQREVLVAALIVAIKHLHVAYCPTTGAAPHGTECLDAQDALQSIGKHVRDAAPSAPKEPRP